MTYKDKASYASSPPCISVLSIVDKEQSVLHIFIALNKKYTKRVHESKLNPKQIQYKNWAICELSIVSKEQGVLRIRIALNKEYTHRVQK